MSKKIEQLKFQLAEMQAENPDIDLNEALASRQL